MTDQHDRQVSSVSDREWAALLNQLLEGNLSAGQNFHLDELLQECPQRIEEYVAHIQIDQLLAWNQQEHRTVAENERLLQPLCLSAVNAESCAGYQTRWTSRLTIPSAVLVVIGIISGVLFLQPGQSQKEELPVSSTDRPAVSVPIFAAMLLDSEDAFWGHGDPEIPFGTQLRQGERLLLESGIARLAFGSGAGVLLEGPAEIELCSSQQACLHYGKLAAYVPEDVDEFSVVTDSLTIQDDGTTYETTIGQQGEAVVQVFDGEVTVNATQHSSRTKTGPLKVRASERVRIIQGMAVSDQPKELTLQEYPDVPDREQLEVAKRGSYPPKHSKPRRPAQSFVVDNRSRQIEQPRLNGLLLADQFQYPDAVLNQSLGGVGFGQNPWVADLCFVNPISLSIPLQVGELTGGSVSLELWGRDPAYPKLANRIRRKFHTSLPEEFYFSILGRYHGLDEDDFFSFWFDSHHRHDHSHANAPNIGFKNNAFYARFFKDEESYAAHVVEGQTFLLVGRLSKYQSPSYNTLALWCNPESNSQLHAPDAVSFRTHNKHQYASFNQLGVRMGAYTEPEDRLLFDRISVGTSFEQVIVPNSLDGNTP